MQIPVSLLTHVALNNNKEFKPFNNVKNRFKTPAHKIVATIFESELQKTKLSSAIHQIRSETNTCKYPRTQSPISLAVFFNIKTTHTQANFFCGFCSFCQQKASQQNNGAQFWAQCNRMSSSLCCRSLTERCVCWSCYWFREAANRWRWRL